MPGFETKPEWTEIRYRITDPANCGKKYGRKQIARGVSLIVCQKKGGTGWINQALRFSKKVFPTIAAARKWFNEHWKKKNIDVWDMLVAGEYTDNDIKALGIIPVSYRGDDCACKIDEFVFDYTEFDENMELAIIDDVEDGFKEIQVFKCDKYSCTAVDEGGKKVLVIHGTAVTTSISNKQRFPPEVLERDGKTLIDKPLIVYHSKFPEAISHFDIIGMIVDAKFNEKKQRLDFWAKVFDERAIQILEQRKSDGKPLIDHFSVGYYHTYDVDDDGIKVSNRVDFHHLGWLLESDAADKDSDLLEILHENFPENIVAVGGEKREAVMAYNTLTLTRPAGSTWEDSSTGGGMLPNIDITDDSKKYWLVPYPEYPSNVWEFDFKKYWSNKGTDGDTEPEEENEIDIDNNPEKTGAGSSAEMGAKPMDEEQAKKQAEELAASKAEIEKLKAELAAKEEAIKENSDALEAALKEKEEAENDIKEKAVLLQQVDEEKLAAKVEEFIENGTIAAAKREEVLNLLKPLDEEARKNFLAVLETKDKDVPAGEEKGKEGAPEDGTEQGAEMMSDETAEKMSQELYQMPYAELVTGKKKEVSSDATS